MPKRTAVILRVDQAPEVVRDFDPYDHERVRDIVGGYAETFRPHPVAVDALEQDLGVTLSTGTEMWHLRVFVNELGHQEGLPLNALGTILYRGPRSADEVPHDIVGNCILVEVD